MSKRLKINSQRLVALRRSPRQLQILLAVGTIIRDDANDDFYQTADGRHIYSQEMFARSPTPYDVEARTSEDRIRVYVNTASYAARRHEKSSRGSSLLRAFAKRAGS